MSNRYLTEKEKKDLEMQVEDSKKDSSPPAYPDPVVDQPSAPTATVVQAPVVLPGVVVAQPTGMWKKPWNSLSWCDSEVCLACCAIPCYHGRLAAKIDGEQACMGAACTRIYCGCWFCNIPRMTSLQGRIAASRGIHDIAGCCTILCCEACVLAQMYYEISE